MPFEYDFSRKILLEELRSTRKRFFDLLEGGSRDWKLIEELFFQQMDLQKAADILCKISNEVYEEKQKLEKQGRRIA